MNKGKILSKFVAKDYETKLEEILEDKDFSEDVKNLLLSCVYKIEAGYKDYEQVKQIVQKKEEYLENILNIVKDKCNEIEIIKNNKNIKRKYEVDKFKGKIKLWHPNEKSLLYAIYELDDSPIYVDEKYRFVRVALTELINEGENINNLEVLRDFNGWNWNTLSSEIPNISVNLIYQNLVYLLGIDFLKTWLHAEEIKDYFAIAKDILKEKYGTQNANEFIEHMNNISIITCVEHNEKEKLRLQEEKEEILKELDRLNNKTELLNTISKEKKEAFEKIKEIDEIVNDKKRLEEEFKIRNEKLPEYNKIFSLAHLTEILARQRKKLLAKVDENNKILEPRYYMKVKCGLEKDLKVLENIELGKDKEKRIKTEEIKLENVMMKCLELQVENAKEKEELLKELYMIRYYFFLNLSKDSIILKEPKLQKSVKTLKKTILKKAIDDKLIIKIVKDDEINFDILSYIFENRIINLENLVIELEVKDKLIVRYYDGDILDKELTFEEIDKSNLLIKKNKKTKIFLLK